MNWKLIDIKQETTHKFLNFYTLIYEVKLNNGETKKYEYFMASRHTKEELLVKTHNYKQADGVVIALYYQDEINNDIYILLTTQFRPALGKYVTSLPAGLIDKDEDEIKAAIREAKEEAGVSISEVKLLAKSSPTSSGLSDETNAVVLAKIINFKNKNLEEFEDINTKLVKLKDIDNILNDDNYFIAMNVRLILLYLKQILLK